MEFLVDLPLGMLFQHEISNFNIVWQVRQDSNPQPSVLETDALAR
jgi:hypothetical protein